MCWTNPQKVTQPRVTGLTLASGEGGQEAVGAGWELRPRPRRRHGVKPRRRSRAKERQGPVLEGSRESTLSNSRPSENLEEA